MGAQPVHWHEPDTFRVRHTIGGISDVLRGSRQAQFFAELLRAQQGQELDDVLMPGGAERCSTPTRTGTASTQPQWTEPSPPRPWTRSCVVGKSASAQ